MIPSEVSFILKVVGIVVLVVSIATIQHNEQKKSKDFFPSPKGGGFADGIIFITSYIFTKEELFMQLLFIILFSISTISYLA